MESGAVPENTPKAIKSGMNKLFQWLRKREISVHFHTISADELATILRRFYAEVKKENGKPLTPSSSVGIRAALNRYLLGTPLYRNMDVVSGPCQEFVVANKYIKGCEAEGFESPQVRKRKYLDTARNRNRNRMIYFAQECHMSMKKLQQKHKLGIHLLDGSTQGMGRCVR